MQNCPAFSHQTNGKTCQNMIENEIIISWKTTSFCSHLVSFNLGQMHSDTHVYYTCDISLIKHELVILKVQSN
jgi:hypothetical protein